MLFLDKLEEIREEGREEGWEEGWEEGREEGRLEMAAQIYKALREEGFSDREAQEIIKLPVADS